MNDSETRLENPTEVMHGVDRLQSVDPHPVAAEPAAAASTYVKEPVFSKRVMLSWALGTLVAWFALTVVVPAVVSSVVAAVKSSITAGPAGTTTIETRREVITISKDAEGQITIRRKAREPVAVPSEGPLPAQPAAPAEPVPLPEPTGKK